jgi:hypothetical protein
VRCMLMRNYLAYILWGEVVGTTKYLINKCPSTRICFKTPLEI